MGVRISWEGRDEFLTALRNLPEDLAAQAAQVVRASAEQAGQETKADYPIRQTNQTPSLRRHSTWFPPGNLRKGVTVADKSTLVSAAYVVRSAAPHAHLFERGTLVRRTRSGANRGAMPQANVAERMIPKVVRIRQRMVQQLIAIVRAAGFEVSGE